MVVFVVRFGRVTPFVGLCGLGPGPGIRPARGAGLALNLQIRRARVYPGGPACQVWVRIGRSARQGSMDRIGFVLANRTGPGASGGAGCPVWVRIGRSARQGWVAGLASYSQIGQVRGASGGAGARFGFGLVNPSGKAGWPGLASCSQIGRAPLPGLAIRPAGSLALNGFVLANWSGVSASGRPGPRLGSNRYNPPGGVPVAGLACCPVGFGLATRPAGSFAGLASYSQIGRAEGPRGSERKPFAVSSNCHE